MTKQETAKVITVIMATYPGHYKGYTPVMIDNLVGAWSMVFSEYTYKRANEGLMRYLKSDKAGFPPSPGQIIARMPSEYEEQLKEIQALEDKRRLPG